MGPSSSYRSPSIGCAYELTDLEIQQLKEHNQKRVKRVVAVVAITLTVVSIILVAFSLSLGPKIDQLVSESLEKRLSSEDLFSQKLVNVTNNHH